VVGAQGCLCTAAVVTEALEIGEDAVVVGAPTPRFEICVHPVNVEECWGRPDCKFMSIDVRISEKHVLTRYLTLYRQSTGLENRQWSHVQHGQILPSEFCAGALFSNERHISGSMANVDPYGEKPGKA
jgi:hypothetical protein